MFSWLEENKIGNIAFSGKKFSAQRDERFKKAKMPVIMSKNGLDAAKLLLNRQINSFLGTKLYNAEFLTDHKIKFDETLADETAEFVFQAEAFLKSKYFMYMSNAFYVAPFNSSLALEEQSIKNISPLSYQTHVSGKGWSDWKSEEQISNDLEQKRQIEAIKINFPSHKVYYAVYWNDAEGWSAEVAAPEHAGTIGKAKPIMGIKIRLDEAGAKDFDIFYRVHTFDGTWTTWAKNSEVIYSYGQKLNAIQIKLENKSNKSSF